MLHPRVISFQFDYDHLTWSVRIIFVRSEFLSEAYNNLHSEYAIGNDYIFIDEKVAMNLDFHEAFFDRATERFIHFKKILEYDINEKIPVVFFQKSEYIIYRDYTDDTLKYKLVYLIDWGQITDVIVVDLYYCDHVAIVPKYTVGKFEGGHIWLNRLEQHNSVVGIRPSRFMYASDFAYMISMMGIPKLLTSTPSVVS